MIPVKTNTTRKSAAVHTIGYSDRMIEKDGFKVIVDENGGLLTDMELLAKLRTLRQALAQETEWRPLASCMTPYWYFWQRTDRCPVKSLSI